MPRSIFLVDDDCDSAFLLRRDVGRAFPEAKIHMIPSGAALRHIALAPPDLLVSGYRLQGMTGLGLVAQIREAGGRFPIAMISSMPLYQAPAFQAGANIFLTYEDAKQIGDRLRELGERPIFDKQVKPH